MKKSNFFRCLIVLVVFLIQEKSYCSDSLLESEKLDNSFNAQFCKEIDNSEINSEEINLIKNDSIKEYDFFRGYRINQFPIKKAALISLLSQPYMVMAEGAKSLTSIWGMGGFLSTALPYGGAWIATYAATSFFESQAMATNWTESGLNLFGIKSARQEEAERRVNSLTSLKKICESKITHGFIVATVSTFTLYIFT